MIYPEGLPGRYHYLIWQSPYATEFPPDSRDNFWLNHFSRVFGPEKKKLMTNIQLHTSFLPFPTMETVYKMIVAPDAYGTHRHHVLSYKVLRIVCTTDSVVVYHIYIYSYTTAPKYSHVNYIHQRHDPSPSIADRSFYMQSSGSHLAGISSPKCTSQLTWFHLPVHY